MTAMSDFLKQIEAGLVPLKRDAALLALRDAAANLRGEADSWEKNGRIVMLRAASLVDDMADKLRSDP